MRIQQLVSCQEVAELLRQCGLPDEDILPTRPLRFFGLWDGGGLVAVVGLELLGSEGLLRSLAVRPALRNRGIAQALVAHAESFSIEQGVERLFLLTTTAEGFFRRLGYLPISRDEAPPVIRDTPQFAALCPASAALLCKPVEIERL
ncbi:MAG: arsenic resistance N-acetyltransferase ArsN2 [Candidatus Thiodiazotropha sp.]